MSLLPQDFDDRNYAAYLPQVNKSLARDLEVRLRDCFLIEGAHASPQTNIFDVGGADTSLLCLSPTSDELSVTLATVQKAAVLMGEAQTLLGAMHDFTQVECMLKQQILDYEKSYDIIIQNLQSAQFEADTYKRLFLEAELKLGILTGAISEAFCVLPVCSPTSGDRAS